MTIKNLLASPLFLFGTITALSLIALGAAFYAEGVLKLEPCIMCIYQRYPFAAAAILGFLGLIAHKKPALPQGLLSLIALAFLANTALAIYHTGIEQDWWVSAVEGCSAVFETDTNKSFLENIMSAPTGSCSEIPWQDPILKLSMANYNIILCFGLFVLSAAGAFLIRKHQPA